MSGGGAAKAAGKAHGKRHGKKHGGHEEEHENHERWLVSYADMMTLLMVLFIVMFAISQVDQKKFEELKNGLAVGFGSPSEAFNGGAASLFQSSDTDSPLDIATGSGGNTQSTTVQQEVKDAVSTAQRAKDSADQQAAQQEVQNYDKIEQQIKDAVQKTGQAQDVKFTIDERGLVVTVVTSAVVFPGSEANLLPAGQQILDGIGPAIAPLPNRIEVDGHTNQLSGGTGTYPSGWELSSARASSVVRYLTSHSGLKDDRMFVGGYADTKPLYPASDPRSVTLNRRVDIVVLSNLSATQKALLPSAAGNG
jgi:chemotaxis protein MotB